MKEREINLIDLLFEILLKWRMIFVFMLIGGILLGGYSYMNSAKTIKVQQTQSVLTDEEKMASLEAKLTDEEKVKVIMALDYANYATYYNESVLMQIDANNAPTTELVWDIQAEDEAMEAELVRVYEQMFEAGVTEWLIQNGMDEAEASKVNELIITEAEGLRDTDYIFTDKNGVIYISVVHVDEDSCKALADMVKAYVNELQKELAKQYGEHKVTVVSETYATVINTDLLSKQRNTLLIITDCNTKIAAMEKEFTEEQKQYFELLQKDVIVNAEEVADTEAQPETAAAVPAPSISIKFVAVGMALFAFLYVFFIFVTYIFNNKLRANDDLAVLYDIPQLGAVNSEKSKKKFLGFIDKWLLSLRDRNKREFTAEESKEIAAVAIKVAAKKSDSNEVYLIGCDLKKQASDLCTGIQDILKEDNIKIEILDNVLYNAEEMDRLTDVQCAVLVETVGSTMYDEVTKELELLKRNNINVLGGILVD
ncbi:MAG: hypothetical protein IJD31_09115 [Lachnospiraceae bacterium]|nr:hypothetical protein [Lachnospiraceae bacterium]